MPTHLSGLTPREAITDAIYRAVTAYDRADETLLRSSAVTDITFTLVGMGDPVSGIDNVIAGNFAHVSQMDTTHSLSEIRIDVAAGAHEARATLNAVAMHCSKGQGVVPGHKFYQVGSLYDLELVLDEKDGGIWKVKNWVLTPVWTSGDPSVMMP